MANTFLENLDTLKKRLTVVPLSKMPLEENPHLDLLCNFEARPIILSDGSAVISELQKYITGIWEEQEFYIPYKGDYLLVKYPEYNWPIKRDNDSDRNRIFLVLDKENNEVAFVFGLSCGLILDVPDKITSKYEETIVDSFFRLHEIKDQQIRNNLEKELCNSVKKVLGEEQTKRLMTIAEQELYRAKDRKYTGETDDQSLLCQESFPAMELTHFVKNTRYKLPEKIQDFSLGEYVFWEIILEKLKTIKEEAGLQYVYLFAADPYMAGNPLEEQFLDDIVNSGKITPEEISEIRDSITGKLVSYYRNTFGFRIVEEKRLVKPAYDSNCFSMYAPLKNLEEMKELSWKSLDTDNRRRKLKKGKRQYE